MTDSAVERPIAQQARSRKTEQAILQAALQVLVDSGEDSLTVNVVSDRAGVSVGSIYRRFGSRDALMIATAGEFAQGFLHQVIRRLDAAAPSGLSSPEEIIASATSALASTFRDNARPFGRFLLMGLADRRIFHEGQRASLAGGEAYMRFMLQAKDAIRRPDVEAAVDYTYQLIYGVCSQRITLDQLASRRNSTWAELINELVEINIAYLLNPPARGVRVRPLS